jgi:hypothetical protein
MVQFAEHSRAMEVLRPVLEQIFVTGEVQAAEVIPEACEKITKMLTEG